MMKADCQSLTGSFTKKRNKTGRQTEKKKEKERERESEYTQLKMHLPAFTLNMPIA